MRFTFSLSLCMVLNAVTILSDVVKNGGFERKDVFSKPLGWKEFGCAIAASRLAKSGRRSVVVVSRSGFWAGPRQNIGSGHSRKRYEISAWVKLTEDAANATYEIQMMTLFRRKGKSVYSLMGKIRATASRWRQIHENYQFPKTVDQPVVVYFQGEYGVFPYYEFFVDDVVMTEWREPENWKEEADARIRSYRQADVEVTLTGVPWRRAHVEVYQRKLAFGVGSTVTDQLVHDKQYREHFLDNFEVATLQNSLGWSSTEPEQDKETYETADEIMKVLETHKIPVRGNFIFSSKPNDQQTWVKSLTSEQLLYQMKERIENVVTRYKGRLLHWDVNRMMLHARYYREKLGNSSIPLWMFQETRRHDSVVKLFLNDYGVIATEDLIQEYKDLAKWLIEGGADIGGLGAKGHFLFQHPPDPELIKSRLDKLSALDLPVWLTEVDVVDPDPVSRADKLEFVVRTAFSHPAVEGVILRGFAAIRDWDGDNSSLRDANWTINEAGRRWRAMREEWRTHKTWNETESNRNYQFSGYHGNYVIRITNNDRARQAEFEVTPDKGKAKQSFTFNYSDMDPYAAPIVTSQPDHKDLLKSREYLGCFRDSHRRAMAGFFFTDHWKMTVDKCRHECFRRRFPYAGLEWQFECFCGESYDVYGRRNESWCREPCTGDKTQFCGGGYSLSVFTAKPMENGKTRTRKKDAIATVTESLMAAGTSKAQQTIDLSTSGMKSTARSPFGTPVSQSGTVSSTTNTMHVHSVWPESSETEATIGLEDRATDYIGCFPDSDPPRALRGTQRFVSERMTVALCLAHCSGFAFSGLQYSMECYCGNSYDRYGSLPADQVKCSTPCAGNHSEKCGGKFHNAVYSTGFPVKNLTSQGSYMGCWQDALPNRTLDGTALRSDTLTIPLCISFCEVKGYQYAGLQYGHHCYCGNHYRSRQLASINCGERCLGSPQTFCGGALANSVFFVQAAKPEQTVDPVVSPGIGQLKSDGTINKHVPLTHSSSAKTTVTSDIESTGTKIGCYQDREPLRALNRTQRYISPFMTVRMCIDHCTNFRYAGLQYGTECFCGNYYDRYGVSEQCWAKCAGDTKGECGGSLANTVYATGNPGSQTIVAGSYLGCWIDDTSSGILKGSSIRIFNMTVEVCLAFCRIEAYLFAGLQQGQDCFCGNHYRSTLQPESLCYQPCSGDRRRVCGGLARNSVFSVKGDD